MLTFTVDSTALREQMTGLKSGRVQFAVSKALNNVGKQAQKSVRDEMKNSLNLRRAPWELRAIKISKFATAKSLELVIEIDPRAMNLIRLAGGLDNQGWTDFNGKKYKFIPNDEVFGRKIIERSNPLHPNNLKFNKHGRNWLGNEDTFVLETPTKNSSVPQVWQRVGSAATGAHRIRVKGSVKKATDERFGNTRMLYRLVDRTHTPARLKFYDPISHTLSEQWPKAMQDALAYALRPKTAA